MQEKYDMEELRPIELAKALDVPQRTVQGWLRSGALKGRQKVTGRWIVPVYEARRFLRSRPYAREEAMTMLEDWLQSRFETPTGNVREVTHA